MNGFAPLVAVLVGTDHHRFDRLLEWTAAIAASRDLDFFVQHGATPLPAGLDGASMLGPADLSALLDRADAVVTHAGPGCIMDARAHGHVPIVVPRDPRLGEHVDDHQQRFARFIERSRMVATAHDRSGLEERLRLSVLVPRVLVESGPPAALQRFEKLAEGLVRR